MIWRIARAHRLGDADAADVGQRVWIILADRIGSLREPDRLAAWLATTARRECLRVLADRNRVDLLDDIDEPADDDPADDAVRGDRDAVLWQAFSTLSDRCRRLVGLMAHAPELTHAQLAAAAGLRRASIGSVRGRCLDTLRRKLTVLGVEAAG